MDWPGLMRLGLHQLGLHPRDFWALTPAELLTMLGAEARRAPMSRAALDELIAAYPDKNERTDHGVL